MERNFTDTSLALTAILDAMPGDANRDEKVDAADAAILAANWRKMSAAIWSEGDFNDDGKVDDVDATMLAANWHVGVGGETVPEPGPIVLLIGIFISTAVLRRRSC